MRSRAGKVGTVVVLTALIVGGVAIPAYAETAPGAKITSIPDGGARPSSSLTPLLPTGNLAIPRIPGQDPLIALKAQVTAAETECQVLSERINALEEKLDAAKVSQAWAMYAWQAADTKLTTAKAAAGAAAKAAYEAMGKVAPGLRDKGLISNLQQLKPGTTPAGEGAAYDLARATAEERDAKAALDKADEAEKALAAEVASATQTFLQRDEARQLLDQRRIELEASIATAQWSDEAKRFIAGYQVGQSNEGLIAAPAAQAAVLHALKQLGKPYRFAEEGPDMYDCSGLTWDAYLRAAGIKLPRVANDQYYAYRTKPVAKTALLPGDLLFYATDPRDWKSIHHVMIYLGKENGVDKIVHAPHTGDVVRIATINLSQVDFAVRVIDAVPVPLPAPIPPTTTAAAPAVTDTTTPGNLAG